MPEGFTDFSVSPLDSPFVELGFPPKIEMRPCKSQGAQLHLLCSGVSRSSSMPFARCQGEARTYGVYLGVTISQLARFVTITSQDTSSFLTDLDHDMSWTQPSYFCELVSTITGFHKGQPCSYTFILGGGTLQLENQPSNLTTVSLPETHIYFLFFFITVWQSTESKNLTKKLSVGLKVARDSFGSNRMCQFFCQNPLFMAQAFRKWNYIRGSPLLIVILGSVVYGDPLDQRLVPVGESFK